MDKKMVYTAPAARRIRRRAKGGDDRFIGQNGGPNVQALAASEGLSVEVTAWILENEPKPDTGVVFNEQTGKFEPVVVDDTANNEAGTGDEPRGRRGRG